MLIVWWIVRAYAARQTGPRSLLFGATCLFAPSYLGFWLASIASQSRLSLHLVAIVCLGGAGALTLAWWTALKASR